MYDSYYFYYLVVQDILNNFSKSPAEQPTPLPLFVRE